MGIEEEYMAVFAKYRDAIGEALQPDKMLTVQCGYCGKTREQPVRVWIGGVDTCAWCMVKLCGNDDAPLDA